MPVEDPSVSAPNVLPSCMAHIGLMSGLRENRIVGARPRTPNTIMRTPVPPMRPSPSIVKLHRPAPPPPLQLLLAGMEDREAHARHKVLLEEQHSRTKCLCELLEDELERCSGHNVMEVEGSHREMLERACHREHMLIEHAAAGSFERVSTRAAERVLQLSHGLQREEAAARALIASAETSANAELLMWHRVHCPATASSRQRSLIPSSPKPSTAARQQSVSQAAPVFAATPPLEAPSGKTLLSFALRGRQRWEQEKLERSEAKRRECGAVKLQMEENDARGAVECEELRFFMRMQDREIEAASHARHAQEIRQHEERYGTDLGSGNPTPAAIARQRGAAARRIQRCARTYIARQNVETRRVAVESGREAASRRDDAILIMQRAARCFIARCRRCRREVLVAGIRDAALGLDELQFNVAVLQAFAYARLAVEAVQLRVKDISDRLISAAKHAEAAVRAHQERNAQLATIQHYMGLLIETSRRSEDDGDPADPSTKAAQCSFSMLQLLWDQMQEQLNVRDEQAPSAQQTTAPVVIGSCANIELLATVSLRQLLQDAPEIAKVGQGILTLAQSAADVAGCSAVLLPQTCRLLAFTRTPIPKAQTEMLRSLGPTGTPHNSVNVEESEGTLISLEEVDKCLSHYEAVSGVAAPASQDALMEADDGIPFSTDYVQRKLWALQTHHRDVQTFVELNPYRIRPYTDKTEFESEEIFELANHEMLNRERIIEDQVDTFLEVIVPDFEKKRRVTELMVVERLRIESEAALWKMD